MINALSKNQIQFNEIKQDLLTKSNLQDEMQKIMHDLHPADPPANQTNDLDQLAAQVLKINQTQKENIKTLSEAISVLLTHTGHILQFLRYLGCVRQPQSPENFVAYFQYQFKAKEIDSHTNNFTKYCHAYSKITKSSNGQLALH